jgi:hypothetical protein
VTLRRTPAVELQAPRRRHIPETGCTSRSEFWGARADDSIHFRQPTAPTHRVGVRALEATWRANPESFFDLQPFIESLASHSKADLLRAIVEIALRAPEALSEFGVADFVERDDDGEA